MLISIIIPTFAEQTYLPRTLSELQNQTAFQRGDTQVIVADYGGQTPTPKWVKYVPVDKRGIGYARNVGALSADGDILMSLDADARFNRLDAIDIMASKLNDQSVKIAHCLTIPDSDLSVAGIPAAINQVVMNIGVATGLAAAATYVVSPSVMQKTAVVWESGLTMRRGDYMSLGGYPDLPQGEGVALATKTIRKYGLEALKFVSEVLTITSARRQNNYSLQYNEAYRGDQKITIT